MFGNNTVQSTWGQTQPQQNQQQGPSAFGQPSNNAFGAGGAFGSSTPSTFGQPQQPQQQANPMFGGLGSTPGNTGTSGFGTFGNNSASTSAFGAPKPTTGFGGFGGGGSTFGSGTNAFGTNNPAGTSGSNVFGSNSGPPNAFGGGGGMFGQNKPTTGFGVTTANTSSGPSDSVPPVTTGSSNPPFNVFTEKDGTTSTMLQYQAITAMPAYRGTSFEEIRVQDYQQGRKTAGAFGQSSFGAPAAGSQPTGAFGQPATGSSIFGGSGGGGGNAFGSTPNNQPATGAGFGGFGQNTGSTGGSMFGGGGTSTFGQPQQQQSSGFGGFGQNQQQQQPQQQQQQQPGAGTGSIFGSTTTNPAFSQPNKPTTGFGTFGGGAAGNTFGNNPSTNAFGQPANTGTTGSSIFGQPQQNQGTNTFGGFGANNNNAAKPSIFGQPAQANTTTTGFGGGGGLFGNPQQNQQQGQQPATGGGLFGGNAGGGLFGQQNQQNQQQPNQQQPGGLFGNTQTTQPSGGLFGNTSGGGLFGNNNQQNQQPAQTSSLFGQKPAGAAAGGGLFGGFGANTNNTTQGTGQQTNLWGQPSGQATTQQPASTNAFGTSLFGSKPPGAPNTSTSNTGFGNSLFGGGLGQSTNLNASSAAPVQGSLTASIAEPINNSMPIFSLLPPGPRSVTLDQQPKKKPGFFVDVPTRSPVPRLQLGYAPANSKLRGFGASTAGAQGNNQFSSSLLPNGKSNALSLSKIEGRASPGPDSLFGRSSSPALGSGPRQSVKKLVLDKKVEPSDLFTRSASPAARSSPGKVLFNPALSQAAREKEIAREKDALVAVSGPQNDAAPTKKSLNRFSAPGTSSAVNEDKLEPAKLKHGDYWVKPDLKDLVHVGYEQLVAFEGLIVGRIGYGEIHFLEPVDLTNLSRLGSLLGEVVRFDEKECSVYPDSDDVDKPTPGSGLNVRARIILENCWTVDKATREPIKDEKHPAAVKHLKRLKGMRDTHFESFDIKNGRWTFTVDHF
ncbi:hypothetical protein CONPUDRAFT_136791 [Coniophora puteana RWD-64-598 SS2]|uniref:Peptidase S59 domain-containing protein n=1 Tax=Coniophora puteana (strain RWD-64-598) TaxID=741705 RepID=A0A5M3MSW7_CONPW|nr:uncharacterized protein CONPUDRAFT_136791 [Coniophora puteana RWD-64-598 SS2]EIW82263.1 hypothetical protein CONPUDRAFT_136791 [Coniophora puteana RWD-64-598 SS2]